MNLESNPDEKDFEAFDRVLTGHFINLKLIRLKESVLQSEVVLEVSSTKFEENNQITNQEELNIIEPIKKKLKIANQMKLFILYKVKETESTRHEVMILFHN